MIKNKGGRPRTYSDEEVKAICELYEQYIAESDIPVVAEFAYLNNITRQALYDYPEFSTLTKKAITKKEAQLEKLALFNVVNATMAIFSLKQLGWRDKPEIEDSSSEPLIEAIRQVLGK